MKMCLKVPKLVHKIFTWKLKWTNKCEVFGCRYIESIEKKNFSVASYFSFSHLFLKVFSVSFLLFFFCLNFSSILLLLAKNKHMPVLIYKYMYGYVYFGYRCVLATAPSGLSLFAFIVNILLKQANNSSSYYKGVPRQESFKDIFNVTTYWNYIRNLSPNDIFECIIPKIINYLYKW